MFKKKGSAEPITEINISYDDKSAVEVTCPHCSAKLGIRKNNGIFKIAKKLVIGTIVSKCPNCKKDVLI